MIHFKTDEEIKIMRGGGKILARIRREIVAAVKPGITTKHLEDLAAKLIIEAGCKPAFLHYRGYPAVLCTSVNDEVVHCVPSERVLMGGDIIGLDMGLIYKGYNLDTAVSVGVGAISGESRRLLRITRECLEIAIKQARVGRTTGDIGYHVQQHGKKNGFGVVRDLVGHGIGKKLHEDPPVPNYGNKGEGVVLEVGMVIAIEPMLTAGDWRVVEGDDGFTFRTKDGSRSAHFEHTVAITRSGSLVLTK